MRIAGYCPMGCGETLAAEEDTGVYCIAAGCPEPQAVEKILADPETDHIAVFSEDAFSVQHPLRERIGGDLFDCDLWERLRSLDGPPDGEPGRYRVTVHQPDAYSESYRSGDAGLDFEKLP